MDGSPLPIRKGSPVVEGGENHSFHEFDLMVTGVPGEVPLEVAFVGRGKIGGGLDLMFQDVGLWVSRALQGRDPMTGEELER
jgi:hypothetical protein